MSTTPHRPDLTDLAHAIESRDADAIVAHFAEDATLLVLDRDHPPASP